MALPARLGTMSLLIAALMGSGAAHAADKELEQARSLMRSGKPLEAYVLLEKSEFARAGDVEFDSMLGVAALDGGKPDRATLAFERVLAVNPNAAGARLDMARAYFALGDYARAKREFELVAANDPPPAARLAIDKYLAAIAEQEQGKRTVVAGYAEGFAGYDSNITSVVGDFTNAVLTTYNLPGFQPTGNAIMRSSGIAGAAAGFDILHKVNDAVSVFGGVDARYRNVLSENNYSSEQLDLRGGASVASGANVFRGGLALQDFHQRTDVPTANRTVAALNAEWRRTIGQQDQASLFGLAARQRFPDIPVNDIDTLALGGSWLHLFAGERKPLLYAALIAGRDNARNPLANGSDNSRRYVSGRLHGIMSFGEKLDGFAALGLLKRADRSAFARSPIIDYGDDRMLDVTLGFNWRPRPHWTVRPQVTYTENRSNVALSEYQRTEASITVRYDFQN